MSTQQEEKKPGIELPTAPRKPTAVNARDAIFYGKPKCGKTTAIAQLKNALIIDLEQGAAFQEGMIIEPPKDMGPVSKWKWLKQLAKTIVEQDRPYDYVCIDTLTKLDEWSEWYGTYVYQNSIIGKKFNRDEKTGELLKPDHIDYQSVHTLPNGSGYRYSREALIDMYNTLRYLGKICTIFICHVADKTVGEKQGEQIVVKDLALTGKLKDILAREPDVLANVWNDDGKLMVSFAGKEEKIGGMRATHLKGYVGELLWDKIFIKEEGK